MSRFATKYHSKLYSKFRASTPPIVVKFIIDYLTEKYPPQLNTGKWTCAVDVGCGSGQSTLSFAKYFDKIYGFDSSDTQINEANSEEKSPNIEFMVCPAENIPLEDNSVNLIIVSQAIHWFNKEKFYAKAKRILVPNGVLAIYRYTEINPCRNGKILNSIYAMRDSHPCISPFVSEDIRKQQDMALKDLILPFNDRKRGNDLINVLPASLEYFIGHLKSRSFFEQMRQNNEEKAEEYIRDILNEFKNCLNISTDDELFKIDLEFEYHYAIELGRK